MWVYYGIDGYILTNSPLHDGPSNPLYKNAARHAGAWFSNFQDMPVTLLVPILGIAGALLAILVAAKARLAFIFSAISIIGIIATVGVSMFPFILPSSSNPEQSLIVWDSSSSQLTLFIMLIATAIFLPIILIYTAWVYRVLRGKVTVETIKANHETAY